MLSIAHGAGLSLSGVGAPDPADPAVVAREMGAPVSDTLRSALSKSEARLVLLADPGSFGVTAADRSPVPGLPPSIGGSGTPDALVLREAIAGGKAVLSFEPMPGSMLDMNEPALTRSADDSAGVLLGDAGGVVPPLGTAGEWATFCPALKSSTPVRNAAEVIAQLGTIRVVHVESMCAHGQQSLGARLYDACMACVWLMGVPDRVDAAYAFRPTGPGRALHALPGQTLRGLTGDMTVNLRYADGRCGAIIASDRGGRWHRSLSLLGDNGRLRIYDDGFVWYAPDGRVLDSSRQESRIRGMDATQPSSDGFVRAVVDQILRAVDRSAPNEPPLDVAGVLATAGAALLSARTGEGESPVTLLRMARS